MVSFVPLKSEQVTFPQAHRPGAVPDSTVMSGEDQIFDFQLTILKRTHNKI